MLGPTSVVGEENVAPSTAPSRPFPLYEEREAIDPEVGIVSRVYCEGDGPMNRTCSFHNLCYDGKNMLYFDVENQTDITANPKELLRLGVYESSPLLPLKVKKQGLTYTSIIQWVKLRSFLFFRGHSRNYLHSLLDDYMGLFQMMHFREEGRVGNDNLMVLFDDYPMFEEQDRFPEIMQVFSLNIPRRLTKMWSLMKEEDGYICWKDVTAGPAQHQLGGPGMFHMKKEFVWSFRSYVTEMIDGTKQEIMDDQVRAKKRALIIQRDVNRRITNMKELVSVLEDRFDRLQVWPVQLERLPFKDQVRQVMAATLLIGMHGAGFTNAMFLSKHSTVIELFPWKVLRPLFANICSRLLPIRYKKWENTLENQTIFHKEVLEKYNLNAIEKQTIIDSSDTLYTNRAGQEYWLSQDTHVDVNALADLVNESLSEMEPLTKAHNGPFAPPLHRRVSHQDLSEASLQGQTVHGKAKELDRAKSPQPTVPPAQDVQGVQGATSELRAGEVLGGDHQKMAIPQFIMLLPLGIGLILIFVRRQYKLRSVSAHTD
jgi:hypothetical protein